MHSGQYAGSVSSDHSQGQTLVKPVATLLYEGHTRPKREPTNRQ